MSLPSLFLIGAPKAGTTSLAAWLSSHPDVYFCVPKEPYYWASDYPRLRAHYGFDTRRSYEALFSSAEAARARYGADGSTNYLYSERAVPDILTEVEQPRFLVALRSPADLLVSYHRTELIALNEDETDFATAWRRSLAGGTPQTNPLDPKLVDYPLVGRLGAAVERLLDLVPRESVHFVLFDDLSADPNAVWTALTSFLGLPEDPVPAFDVRNASDKTFRSTSLRRLTHRPPRLLAPPMRWLRQWSRTTSNPVAAALKSRMWRAERRPDVDSTVRAEVIAYLAEDTRLLGKLIGTDLSHWAEARPQ
ncbi:MAG: sulfotransferase [Actinomycetota bacterium]|nr:sulfotransferase [Actinomycetota bacterium]